MQPSDPADPHTPARDDAEPQAAPAPTQRPSLLPESLRAQDPLERARRDRDPGRASRIQRRDQRARARVAEGRRKRLAALLDGAALTAATLAACAAPLALGAVHLVAIAPIALVAWLGAAFALLRVALEGRTPRLGAPGVALLGLAALTLLQATPLPAALLHLLASTPAAWLDLAWTTADGTPALLPLALNPAEALRHGLGLSAAAALVLNLANAAQDDERTQRLLYVLPTLGLALGALGAAQRALGTDLRLFFYQPADLDGAPLFAASFVNPNHLAALLGLASFVPLALTSDEEHRAERPLLYLLAIACLLGMAATLSGQALAAWPVGAIALTSFAWQRGPSRSFLAASTRPLAVGAAAAVALAAWTFAAPHLAEHITPYQGLAPLTPFSAWDTAWSVVQTSPWIGLGPGAFGDAAAILPEHAAQPRFAFANNSPLQAAANWGLPAAALLTATLLAWIASIALRPTWRSKHLHLMGALFASFTFLAVESLGSFSLDIPGVYLPAAFLLGLAVARTQSYASLLPSLKRHALRRLDRAPQSDTSAELPRPLPTSPRRRRLRLAATAAALLALPLLTLLAALPLRHTLAHTLLPHSAPSPLQALARDTAPLPEDVQRAAADALTPHPTLPSTHLTAAIAYSRADQPERALQALDTAATFNPASPAPWLLRARLLLAAQEHQPAAQAYREALQRAVNTRGPGRVQLAVEVVQRLKAPDEVARVLPPDPALWDDLLQRLSDSDAPTAVIDLANALASAHPEQRATPDAWRARALAHLNRWDEARTLALQLTALPKPPAAAFAILARDATHRGDPHAAREHLKRGLEQHPQDPELRFLDAEALLDWRQTLGFEVADPAWLRTLQEHLRTLRPRTLRDPHLRYRFFLLSARTLYAQGRSHAAIADLRAAVKADPARPEAALLLADLLREEHEHDEAAAIYNDLLRRFPDHPRAPDLRRALQDLPTLPPETTTPPTPAP